MDIYDLLDNSETIQLKILRKIFSAGEKGVACAEVRRSLKINANTVLEAVGLFNDFFKETYVDRKVAINYTSETGLLTLDTEENIDFSEIYSTFLRRSINYQIIQKVSFESSSISQLAVRLYLSEATIFRKIKLLNSKIDEFQLKIKNVKMHGDEIQIRYLLYSLTVNAYTFNQHLLKFQERTHPFADAFINTFEVLSNYKFSIQGKIKLRIWLDITIKRIRLLNDTSMDANYLEVENQALYKAIKKSFLSILDHYSLLIGEDEIMILYSFMVSFELYDSKYLPLGTKEINSNGKVALLDKEFLRRVHEVFPHYEEKVTIETRREIEYSLTNLHCKITKFCGSFYYFSGKSISHLANMEIYQRLLTISNKLVASIEESFSDFITAEVLSLVYRRYFNLLLEILKNYSIKIRIGVSIHKDYSIKEGVFFRLTYLMHYFFDVEIEEAAEQQKYDLLITDLIVSTERFAHDYYYLLTDIETTYDSDRIQKILVKIYKKKV